MTEPRMTFGFRRNGVDYRASNVRMIDGKAYVQSWYAVPKKKKAPPAKKPSTKKKVGRGAVSGAKQQRLDL